MTFAGRVHWLCASPSPYNSQLFRAIAAEQDIELLVHYRRLSLSSHPWQSKLTEGCTCRAYREVLGIDWTLVRLALKPQDELRSEAFVVGGWNHPTAWLLLTLLALRRANFVIWTDTPNPARKPFGWRQWVRKAFLKWVFTQARHTMGTGEAALRALARMGAPRAKLINFPCWIDLDLYARARDVSLQPRETEDLIFFSSGRIQNDLKGHHVAIRALALAARRVARSFEYRIAGTGPDAELLPGLANELGIGDRVKLLGWLEPGELIEQLKTADVMIHPSPVHEPYGVAVIEAMAAGMVVLASDVTCAALDRVESGINGLIHRAGDVEELAAQVEDLLVDPSKIVWMGEAARRTAEQWPVSRGLALIKQALNGPFQP